MNKVIVISAGFVHEIFNSEDTIENIRQNLKIRETDEVIKVDQSVIVSCNWIWDGEKFTEQNKLQIESDENA